MKKISVVETGYIGNNKVILIKNERITIFMQFLQTIFAPVVLIFILSNMTTMGLRVKLPEVMVALQNKQSLVLIFVWGWALGPALGYLITRILPLAEPYVIVMFLASLAPCAPFLQLFVEKARGNIGFAGAFIPLVVVGTVVLMPLMVPLLIKGLNISAWAIAKPLLLTILLPLIIGAAIRHFFDSVSNSIFPAISLVSKLFTLIIILLALPLYGRGMLNIAGSFALVAMTLFMVGMVLITYRFGFGLKRSERTVMALGMGTRNIAAVLSAVLAIPNVDPRTVVMVIMWTLWSFILSIIGAKIFARQADKVATSA